MNAPMKETLQPWGTEHYPPPHIMKRNARRQTLIDVGWGLLIIVGMFICVGFSLVATALVTDAIGPQDENTMMLTRVGVFLSSLLAAIFIAGLIIGGVMSKRQHDMATYRPKKRHR